jgi:hypothetical protein
MALYRYVEDVGRLYRRYTHEAVTSFLQDSNAIDHLHHAHENFRSFIAQRSGWPISTRVLITLSDQLTFDLTTLSNYPNWVLGVYRAADGDVDEISGLLGVAAGANMLDETAGTAQWDETLIRFSGRRSGNYVLQIVEEVPSTVWTTANLAEGQNEEIEANPAVRQFLDLIALYAASDYYAIKDGADDPVVERRRIRRESDLNKWLIHRQRHGTHRISRTDTSKDYYG